MKRLKKKEYVELWHFTIQGCRDAALTDLTTPNDTFGLVNTNDGLRLQTVGASTISSKITRDENLSWEQMSEGKSRLLDCMSTSGWSNREVGELAKFFVKLDLHLIRSQEYGSQTVLQYQDRVHQDWVRSINEKKPYPIGSINDELMKEYQRQILVELQARNIVSAFIAPNEKRNRTLTISPRTTRASHSPHHRSHRTCTASPIPAPSHAPTPLHCFRTASLAPAPLHMHLHLVSTIPPCPPPPTCHTSAPLPTSMTRLTIGPAEQHEARRVQQKLMRARLQGSRCQTVQIWHVSIQVSSQTLQQPTSSFAITRSSKKAKLSGVRVRTKLPRQTRSLPHLLGQTPTPYRLLPSHRNMEQDEIVMFPDLERPNPQHTRCGHLLRLAATQPVLRHVRETRARVLRMWLIPAWRRCLSLRPNLKFGHP